MNLFASSENELPLVLWLPSWYPGPAQGSNGDFIERQAASLQGKARLLILFVERDPALKRGTTKHYRETPAPGIVLYRVYYGAGESKGLFSRMYSLRAFIRLQRKMYNLITKQEGVPSLVHVHVALKAGLLALWLRRKRKLPYLLTEHWTGYLSESRPGFSDLGWIQQWLTLKIICRADRLLPVSAHLGRQLQSLACPVPITVVPNVVNTDLFFFKASPPPVFRFLHASYLNFQKYPEALIRAAAVLDREGWTFELVLLGNEVPALEKQAEEAGLLNRVVFLRGAVPYAEVAREMQQSSCFLLFSRFENLPCVLLEALCCGLPVISTAVGGIPEVLGPNNGILLQPEDENALCEAMRFVLKNPGHFNPSAIAAEAREKFSYQTIGSQLSGIYREMIR